MYICQDQRDTPKFVSLQFQNFIALNIIFIQIRLKRKLQSGIPKAKSCPLKEKGALLVCGILYLCSTQIIHTVIGEHMFFYDCHRFDTMKDRSRFSHLFNCNDLHTSLKLKCAIKADFQQVSLNSVMCIPTGRNFHCNPLNSKVSEAGHQWVLGSIQAPGWDTLGLMAQSQK